MWKDFFYYSKSERRSILVLSGIGILLLVSGTWVHTAHEADVPMVDSIMLDSFCIRDYQHHLAYDSIRKYSKRRERQLPVLADFDPNTADSAELCRLGLPPFMAGRILKYRSKGGIFRKPEDFARIYGLSQEQYLELQPFIVIDRRYVDELLKARSVTPLRSVDSTLRADSVKNLPSPRLKYPEGTVLDLNAADTAQLKQVPGIGSGLSKMIVAYRNRLGGYARVEQLQEIPSIDRSLNKWFKVDSCIFRPIRVNHANLDQLRNHPYMNFYKAKVILEYRRKRGKIKGLSQLSMFQEFTEKDLQRLEPYLSFE